MNIIQKITWRVRLIQAEAATKDPVILLYGLLPQVLRNEQLFHRIVFAKIRKEAVWNKLITIEEREDGYLYDFKIMKILYPKHATCLPLIDQFVEILVPYLDVDEATKRSLERLTPGRPRVAYEHQGVTFTAGDHIIDAGANVGVFSILVSRMVGSGGTIYAFEPMPEPRAFLRKNLALNGATNVEVVEAALGSESVEREFFVGIRKASGSAYFTRGRTERVVVSQISCDDFVRERTINRIDGIKVDIEGMELEFLQGARRTIQRDTPRMAMAAYHRDGDFEKIERALKELVPQYRTARTSDKIFAWI